MYINTCSSYILIHDYMFEYNIYMYMYTKIYIYNMQTDNISFSDILSLFSEKLNPLFSNSGYLFYNMTDFLTFRTWRILDVRIRDNNIFTPECFPVFLQ